MIWVSYRVQRSIYLVALGVAAAFALFLGITGAIQAHAWTVFNSHGCNAVGYSSRCISFQFSYLSSTHFSTVSAVLCGVLPGLVGLVFGVPIVAGELEGATNRLAWTQSITRTRWMWSKIGLGALLTTALVAAFIPLLWWWSDATQRGSRIEPSNFDITGVVPVAYAIFAFSLGTALGAIVRRRGWAFALGVPLFALARLYVRDDLRASLVAPSYRAGNVVLGNEVGSVLLSANDWNLNSGYVPLGRTTPAKGKTWESLNGVMARCTSGKAAHSAGYCTRLYRVHFVESFQPPSHYWALQGVESALFIAASLVALLVALVAVRRWRT